jgi:hypothetical protein
MPRLTETQWTPIEAEFERGDGSAKIARKWSGLLGTHIAPSTIRMRARRRGLKSMPHRVSNKFNWTLVRADRVAGRPEAEILTRHGLSKRQYRDYAKQHNWPAPVNPMDARVTALYRDDKLTVAQIAEQLDKHPQWVYHKRRELKLPNRPRGRKRVA